jgi:asparagine synthase (glutamine-hydrolysing)
VSPEIDLGGLAGFLLWGAVPEPFTIRRSVRALPAGSYLLAGDGASGEARSYYRFGDAASAAVTPLAPVLAVEESVAAHLVSDVPVAVFLSSGLDSGLIAALACRHLPEPPVTLTARFDALVGSSADEGPLAARVAAALGTRHVETVLGQRDFDDLWGRALRAMDQPSIDGFNTFMISRVAHESGLKVVLSGLGGDELFGSYPSFRDVPRGVRTARRLARMPGLAGLWPSASRLLFPRRPKVAGLLRHGASVAGSYLLRRGLFLPEELPEVMGKERAAEGLAHYQALADAAAPSNGRDPWSAVHALETALYMKNQLLRDADWASMAHSVELRVPLADPVLRAHLAAAGFEPARSAGKAAFVRQVVPHLPAELFSRAKTGFTFPMVEWMRPEAFNWSPAEKSRHLARAVLDEMGVALR